MGESANLAFYAIVYAKGLVPRDRLQEAMNRATLEGAALDAVLLQWRMLDQGQCDEILRLRTRLGRRCGSCGGTTFLLQDQNEQTTPCEFCGGRLQPLQQQQPQQQHPSARYQRSGLPPPNVPGQGQRGTTGRHSAAQLQAARQSGAHPRGQSQAQPAAAPADLEQRLRAVRDETLQQAMQAVEARLAQEDLKGFLAHVTQQAAQQAADVAGAKVEEIRQQLTQLEALQRQLRQLEQQQQQPDVVALGEQIQAQVMERVQDHLARTEAAAPQVDEAAIVDHATRASLTALQDSINQFDLAGLPERIKSEVLAALPAPAAPAPSEPLAAPDVESVASEASRRALESLQTQLDGYDLNGLPARLTTQVMEALKDELAALESNEAVVAQATASAIEAIQEDLPDQVTEQVLERVESRLRKQAELEASIDRRIAEAVAELGVGGQPGPADPALVESVAERVEERLSAPGGMAEEITRHLLEKIPQPQADGLSEKELRELAGEAAQVAQRGLRSQLAEEVQSQLPQALESLRASLVQQVGEGVWQQLDLTGLEARILARVHAEGAPQQASPGSEASNAELMAKVERRLSEFDLAASSLVAEAREQAVAAAVQQLEARLAANGGAGGGPVDTDQIVERVMQLMGGAPPAGGAAAQLSPEAEEALTGAVTANVLRRVEEHIQLTVTQSGTGAVDEAAVVERVLQALEPRLKSLSESRPALPGGDERPKGNTGVYDRKFIALAREVKNLKESFDAGVPAGSGGLSGVFKSNDFQKALDDRVKIAVEGGANDRDRRALLNSEEFKSPLEARINQALQGAGAAVPGKKGGELVALLNTPEFKEVFDQKINQVLSYVKSDLIPSAVKRALREVESS